MLIEKKVQTCTTIPILGEIWFLFSLTSGKARGPVNDPGSARALVPQFLISL